MLYLESIFFFANLVILALDQQYCLGVLLLKCRAINEIWNNSPNKSWNCQHNTQDNQIAKKGERSSCHERGSDDANGERDNGSVAYFGLIHSRSFGNTGIELAL